MPMFRRVIEETRVPIPSPVEASCLGGVLRWLSVEVGALRKTRL